MHHHRQQSEIRTLHCPPTYCEEEESMEDPTHERWLADLIPAERIHYFYGQLLSADDFQKEQDYWRRKSQLHNRFELGQGVVCGLGVTPLTTTRSCRATWCKSGRVVR